LEVWASEKSGNVTHGWRQCLLLLCPRQRAPDNGVVRSDRSHSGRASYQTTDTSAHRHRQTHEFRTILPSVVLKRRPFDRAITELALLAGDLIVLSIMLIAFTLHGDQEARLDGYIACVCATAGSHRRLVVFVCYQITAGCGKQPRCSAEYPSYPLYVGSRDLGPSVLARVCLPL